MRSGPDLCYPIAYLCHWLTVRNSTPSSLPDQTKTPTCPTYLTWPTYLAYLPDLPSWYTYLIYLPDLPNWPIITYRIRCFTRPGQTRTYLEYLDLGQFRNFCDGCWGPCFLEIKSLSPFVIFDCTLSGACFFATWYLHRLTKCLSVANRKIKEIYHLFFYKQVESGNYEMDVPHIVYQCFF